MSRLLNTLFALVNRYSPVLIQVPWPHHFGNCAEEIRYGLLRAQREHKRALFVVHRHELWGPLKVPVANRELFCIESDDLYPAKSVVAWLAGWLLTAWLFCVRPWNLLWRSHKVRRSLRRVCPWVRVGPIVADPGAGTIVTVGATRLWQTEDAHTFSWDVVDRLAWRRQYEVYCPPRLSAERRRQAERLRQEMGIPADDWFVALHVREGGGSGTVNYRDSSISNYIETIRSIIKAGGWVVRLGDRSVTPLPPMERAIDYAHSRWKSAVMDLYLISECLFYLGTTSGPYDVALLFGKPVLTVNATEWSYWGPIGPQDRGILKHVFSRRLQRVLTLQELVEEPFACQSASTLADSHEYELIENSSDEIRAAVEDFMRFSPVLSDIQLRFNAARSRAVRRWLDDGEPRIFLDPIGRLTEQYRLASRVDVAGSLSHSYLEQNWDRVPGWLSESGAATDPMAPVQSMNPRRTNEGSQSIAVGR